MPLLIFNLLALAGVLHQSPSPSPSPSPAKPPASPCPQASVALPPALDRVLRDYEAAWSRGDAKALAALFAEDGFVMSMGDTPVRGRDQIAARYTGSGGAPLALRAIAFSVEGSTGFILGCYAPKASDPDIGKFTLTLRRNSDGRWLIFSDMDNPNRRR